jgi:hypothetical protein
LPEKKGRTKIKKNSQRAKKGESQTDKKERKKKKKSVIV